MCNQNLVQIAFNEALSKCTYLHIPVEVEVGGTVEMGRTVEVEHGGGGTVEVGGCGGGGTVELGRTVEVGAVEMGRTVKMCTLVIVGCCLSTTGFISCSSSWCVSCLRCSHWRSPV